MLVMISSLSCEYKVLNDVNLDMSKLKRAIAELVATAGRDSDSG